MTKGLVCWLCLILGGILFAATHNPIWWVVGLFVGGFLSERVPQD